MKKGTQLFLVVLAIMGYIGYQSNSTKKRSSAPLQVHSEPEVKNTQAFELKWPGEVEESVVNDAYFTKNYYLVFDGSGSMDDVGCSNGQKKITVAKEAMKAFIDQINPDDNVGLFAFGFNGATERVPLGSNNKELLKNEVNKVRMGGRTPLGRSLNLAYDKLTEVAKAQLGYGEYHIVVLTDGIASDTSILNKAVQKVITKSPIVIHTVGFCIGNDHTLNQVGKTYYKAANDPQSVASGLDEVLAESKSFTVSNFE